MPDRQRDPDDPKGLIRESFKIEGIRAEECRSIFVDWALSLDADDTQAALARLIARHDDQPKDHPMLAVLREGMQAAPAARRRGGRRARFEKG